MAIVYKITRNRSSNITCNNDAKDVMYLSVLRKNEQYAQISCGGVQIGFDLGKLALTISGAVNEQTRQ